MLSFKDVENSQRRLDGLGHVKQQKWQTMCTILHPSFHTNNSYKVHTVRKSTIVSKNSHLFTMDTKPSVLKTYTRLWQIFHLNIIYFYALTCFTINLVLHWIEHKRWVKPCWDLNTAVEIFYELEGLYFRQNVSTSNFRLQPAKFM